jgi:poly(A) polymerase
LLKLLAVIDPVPTIALMVAHGIFAAVIPEIDGASVGRLERLVTRERGFGGDPLRRLAALLPADPARADQVGARLKLSNAQRKRLALAEQEGEPGPARPLAHAIGLEGARDRLLLHAADPAEGMAELADWAVPRFPLTGGALVKMGLSAGPVVAATLQAVERQWVKESFPGEARVREIAEDLVAQALRAR